MTYRKKLIEVSLPLEAINKEAIRENYIYKGNPSSIHKWWSGKPLSASRAILFAQLVDDPSAYLTDENKITEERERLFDIIRNLVIWENNSNEEVLDEARKEIAQSVARDLSVDVPVGKEAVREFLASKAPSVLDPFAGGGSIPLEAQRLGLRALASDLNPVAVLINKALIEIPPQFINLPPIHPADSTLGLASSIKKDRKKKATPQDELWQKEWKGVQGLAEDIRYYGQWLREETFKRIGHFYSPISVTEEILEEQPELKSQGLKVGSQLNVIAWLWARSVTCPNPACGSEAPLTSKWWLSTNKKSPVWAEPIFSKHPKTTVTIKIRTGKGIPPIGTVKRNGAMCIICETPIPFSYIRNEGKNNRLGLFPLAVVVEVGKKRMYLNASAFSKDNQLVENYSLTSVPDTNLPEKALGFRVQLYGLTRHVDLFTKKQLITLSTLLDIIPELIKKVKADILHAAKGGTLNPTAYANAVATYLVFAIDKYLMYGCSLVSWYTKEDRPSMLFTRQAIPMAWDFVEINPFASIGGGFHKSIAIVSDSIENIFGTLPGNAQIADAANSDYPKDVVISTDPPYYDNIGYSDLSDYFYVWLRIGLSKIYPDLFQTLLVPKSAELVADTDRFGETADEHFMKGMQLAFSRIKVANSVNYPLTIYYAFKQTEEEGQENNKSNASTGWEVMLDGLIAAGIRITGTWPVHTERVGRMRDTGSNALATSIVLVCRPQPEGTASASRREFLSALKKELAPALRRLQQGSIAPVDFAQAAIGPGMAVFSVYSAVLEADGKPMLVRTALTLINQALDEFLAEQEGEYDGDTRWALTWFEQYGHNEAAYGVAETLSRAKNTSVDGLSEAGIVEARAGKVRLYRRDELDTNWDPTQDKRLTAWESASHLIYALENGGEESAAELLAKLGPIAEVARDLAYRLYTVCERKGWSQDALGYNMLVVAWPRLKELAAQQKSRQSELF